MEKINKVLACIDFSDYTAEVIAHSRIFAQEMDMGIVLLNVINNRDVDAFKSVSSFFPADFNVEDHVEKIRTVRHRQLAELVMRVCPTEKARFITGIRIGVPYEQILKCIESENIDLVVMANKGRNNLVGTLFGSNAEKVFRHSPVPVLSVRDRARFSRKPNSDRQTQKTPAAANIQRLVAAIDFSTYSPEILQYAAEIAIRSHAELIVVNVINIRSVDAVRNAIDHDHPGSFLMDKFLGDETAKRETRAAELLKKWVPEDVSSRIIIKCGTPFKEILTTVDDAKAELLVLNSKGRTNLSEYLFGTTAEKAFRHCPVPVLSLNLRNSV